MEQEWNGEYMRELRRALVQGEKHPDCSRCWDKEQHGVPSYRQMYNQRMTSDRSRASDIVERAIANDMVVEDQPQTLELRFGNLCNLQCKMCVPSSSSQIAKDMERLKQLDPEGYQEHGHTHFGYDANDYLWYEDAEIWEVIDRIIPHLEYLHFTGGEPTLSPECLALITRCVELGYASQIDLSFCTNATTLPERFIELIQQFHSLSLTLSIDGVGPSYEYVRYPGNWKKVRANIVRLFSELDKPHIQIGYNCAVQIYNILDLPKIIDELMAIPREVGYSGEARFHTLEIVIYPKILSIHNLPQAPRTVARSILEGWINERRGNTDYPFPDEVLARIMDILETPAEPGLEKRLIDYTRFFDQNKKTTMRTNAPLLYKLLHGSSGD